MPNQIHNEEWLKQWEEYWDSKDTDHPVLFNAEFEAEIPGLKNLKEIIGEEWLNEILRFLSRTRSKDDLIKELGEPQNPLLAGLLTLNPFNPHITLISILSEGDLIKNITINPEKDFGLTVAQLMKIFPNSKREKNAYDMRVELTIEPPQKKIKGIWASAELSDDFSKPVNTIIIEL